MPVSLNIPGRVQFVHVFIALYFVVLLAFGKVFTKLQVIGPLYLHDLCLAMLVAMCVFFQPRVKIQFPAIVVMLILSFLYLAISMYSLRGQPELIQMAIRQFAPFLYLFCCYVIFCSQVRDLFAAMKAIRLIRIIGNLSVLIQLVYLAYGFVAIPGFSLFEPLDYPYFSPLTVMGVITFCADAISSNQTLLLKIFKFTAGLLITLTFGHSSAFLAVFIILMLYAYIKIKPVQRVFSLSFIIIAVLFLLFLPQFTDDNAGWRLLYWRHIIERSVSDGYLIFGHGFGQPYMTHDYAVYISKTLNSNGMLHEYYPMARYLNPPHNSILTIVFHLGLLPALLFFAPLTRFFKQIFFKRFPDDNNTMFLILALCGSIVWVCFNVILELPHSATYFWLVFFTTIFYVKTRAR